MSAGASRPIDRTPRQVAGPGVDDDPVTADDPAIDDPVTADDPAIGDPVTADDPAIGDPVTADDPAIGDPVTADDPAIDDRPRDPHPVAADPAEIERLQADEIIVDVSDDRDPADPDIAAAGDPPPEHLADPDVVGDDEAEARPARVGEPVADEGDGVGALADDGSAGDGGPLATAGTDVDADASDPDTAGAEPDLVTGSDPVPETHPVGFDGPGLDGPDLDPPDLDPPDLDPVPPPGGDLEAEPDEADLEAEPDEAELVGAPAGFMADTSALRERWESVQVGFVDDPRHAVEEAHDMVAAAVSELQAQIDRQRDELGGPWRGDDRASTDALLTAFQGYRDLFDRVLGV